MKKFSKKWKSSKNPAKQRKYRYHAPYHIKNKFFNGHLSDNLSKKYGKRTARIRKGDKVEAMRGQFKGKTGKVEKVDIKKMKIYIEGFEVQKNDGTKVKYPITPSNLMINELELSDKKRVEILKRK